MKNFRKDAKRSDLKKIRKHGFTFRLSSSEEDFAVFYDTMYRPYITGRFRDAALIVPRAEFLHQCRMGKLLQVSLAGRIVSTALLQKVFGNLAFVWVGIADWNQETMRKGAFSALYFFTIQHGFEQGCRVIDFGPTRPLLNDGVFRFKRKWGTFVKERKSPEAGILLKPLRFTPQTTSFLMNNPFICSEKRGLSGKILLGEGLAGKEDLENILKYYHIHGLSQLKVFSLSTVTH